MNLDSVYRLIERDKLRLTRGERNLLPKYVKLVKAVRSGNKGHIQCEAKMLLERTL
jgi:hypothetical protein